MPRQGHNQPLFQGRAPLHAGTALPSFMPPACPVCNRYGQQPVRRQQPRRRIKQPQRRFHPGGDPLGVPRQKRIERHGGNAFRQRRTGERPPQGLFHMSMPAKHKARTGQQPFPDGCGRHPVRPAVRRRARCAPALSRQTGRKSGAPPVPRRAVHQKRKGGAVPRLSPERRRPPAR